MINGRSFDLTGASPEWLNTRLQWVRENPRFLRLSFLKQWLASVGVSYDDLTATLPATSDKVERLLQWFKAQPSRLQPIQLAQVLEVIGIRLRLSGALFPPRWEAPELVRQVFPNSSPWGDSVQYNWMTIYSWEWVFSNTLIGNLPGVYKRFPDFVRAQRKVNSRYGSGDEFNKHRMLLLTAQELWRNGVPPFWFAGYIYWGEHEYDYGIPKGEFKSLTLDEWKNGGFSQPYNAKPYLIDTGFVNEVTPPISWGGNGINVLTRITSQPVTL